MRKLFSLLLSLALLSGLLATSALAINDAADLSYQLVLEVQDASGAPKTTFSADEALVVKVFLQYTGTGIAPIYGLQGELVYDTYCLEYKGATVMEKAAPRDNRVAFAFLSPDKGGTAMATPQLVGTFRFQSRLDGTALFSVENFMLTNSDVSLREVDDSAQSSVTIGTGVAVPTRKLLLTRIEAARGEMAQATPDGNPDFIYPPGFAVSKTTLDLLAKAVEQALAVHENSFAGADEFAQAIAALSAAMAAFEAGKQPGTATDAQDSWSANTKFTVTAVAGEHGKILSGYATQRVNRGTSATIMALPDEGYDTEYMYVNGTRFPGSDLFTIPHVTKDTEVQATFCKKPPYTDVSADKWYYAGVRYVTNHGLFQGAAKDCFLPDATTDRAMLATVLHRLAGTPAATLATNLEDVGREQWYTSAVDWAVESGVMVGLGNGTFGVSQGVTREQIAVVLYRYAGGEKSSDSALSAYSDVGQVSPWAQDGMAWANSCGLISGSSATLLEPGRTATRAELATILTRFCEMQKDA